MKKTIPFLLPVVVACFSACRGPEAEWKELVAAASVSLDQKTLSMAVGSAETLTATVLPEEAENKNITWVSSDRAIAALDVHGTVTALSAGEATVTVITEDGSYRAVCLVSVFEEAIPLEGISLNATSFSCVAGSEIALFATLTPSSATNVTLLWTSSDERVAKVDAQGKVRALSVGAAVVTATANGKSTTCLVTVSEPEVEVVAIEHISFDRASLALDAGEETTLELIVTPAHATATTVSWVSSDTKVATVEAGRVTAVSAGTTVVTATMGGKSASCRVTVSGVTIPVESILLSAATLALEVGEPTLLEATVAPSHATYAAVDWTSSNEAVATVEKGRVQALSVGETTITATAGGQKALCVVTVTDTRILTGTAGLLAWTLSTEGDFSIRGSGAMPDYAAAEDVPWWLHRARIHTVTVEDGVTRVGDRAFYACRALVEIALSDDVLSVGERAFAGCTGLTSVEITTLAGLKTIGRRAFEGCAALTEISLPSHLTSIGEDAFGGCSTLKRVFCYASGGVPGLGVGNFTAEGDTLYVSYAYPYQTDAAWSAAFTRIEMLVGEE